MSEVTPLEKDLKPSATKVHSNYLSLQLIILRFSRGESSTGNVNWPVPALTVELSQCSIDTDWRGVSKESRGPFRIEVGKKSVVRYRLCYRGEGILVCPPLEVDSFLGQML